eukprot:gene40652-50300_t
MFSGLYDRYQALSDHEAELCCQIATLKDENKELQTECDRLSASLTAQDGESFADREMHSMTVQWMVRDPAEIATLQEQLTEKQLEVDQMKSCINDLQEKSKEDADSITSLTAQCNTTACEIEALSHAHTAVTQELCESQVEVERLQSHIEDLETRLNDRDVECEWCTQLTSLMKAYKELKDKHDKHTDAVQEMYNEMEDAANAKIAEKDAKIKSLQKQITHQRQRPPVFEPPAARSVRTLTAASQHSMDGDTVDGLHEDNKRLSASNAEKDRVILRLQHEISEDGNEIAHLEWIIRKIQDFSSCDPLEGMDVSMTYERSEFCGVQEMSQQQ